MHEKIKSLGGLGGKLSGAGGGGFFFEIVPKDIHEDLINIFGKNKVLKIEYEPFGSRILSEIF